MKSRRIVLLIYVPAVDSPSVSQSNQINRSYSLSLPSTFREVYGPRLTFRDRGICFLAKWCQKPTPFPKPASTLVYPETINIRELLGVG